jgi:hypothetical protein
MWAKINKALSASSMDVNRPAFKGVSFTDSLKHANGNPLARKQATEFASLQSPATDPFVRDPEIPRS